MQLDRIVNFHKTVGDKTRIKIIALLQDGPLHGQALAGKLGLTPPTISYHVTKLREIDIIYQRRDKNTIYFHLNEKKLEALAHAILKIGGEEMNSLVFSNEDKYKIITNFFDDNGRLKNIPAQRKKKLVVLEHLVKGLKIGQIYQEKEINDYIKQFHEDYATIRREFIMCYFMTRQNGEYELNPKEMWLI
jgi:DNA-binding HxlR family transcriptional regulator